MSSRTRFGVSIDSELATQFDTEIAVKGYKTRSKALEDLIRSWLIEQRLTQQNKEAVGVITLLYDHETTTTTGALLHIQHHHAGKVVSTTHIHLNEQACMEVIIVRGCVSEIRHVADELAPVRGVKQVKLTMTADEMLTAASEKSEHAGHH